MLPAVVESAPDRVAFGTAPPIAPGEDAPLSDADRALLAQFTGKL